jgi:hypothetical protein
MNAFVSIHFKNKTNRGIQFLALKAIPASFN